MTSPTCALCGAVLVRGALVRRYPALYGPLYCDSGCWSEVAAREGEGPS